MVVYSSLLCLRGVCVCVCVQVGALFVCVQGVYVEVYLYVRALTLYQPTADRQACAYVSLWFT